MVLSAQGGELAEVNKPGTSGRGSAMSACESCGGASIQQKCRLGFEHRTCSELRVGSCWRHWPSWAESWSKWLYYGCSWSRYELLDRHSGSAWTLWAAQAVLFRPKASCWCATTPSMARTVMLWPFTSEEGLAQNDRVSLPFFFAELG